MQEMLEILETLPMWQMLTDAEKEEVKGRTQVLPYAKGETIYSKESECLGFIRVMKGSVRAFLLSAEGKEITLYHIREGEYDVLSASCVVSQITFDPQMIAESDCQILVIPAIILASLKERNIYLRCSIYEMLTERFSTVTWTLQEVMFLRIDQRLAAFLLRESARQGSAKIKCTHEYIAQDINTAREVVARMLKRFAEEDWIELGRGSVLIKNEEELRAVSGEDA